MFVHSGNTWTQQAYLKASNASAFYRFGFLLGVVRDTLMVGDI